MNTLIGLDGNVSTSGSYENPDFVAAIKKIAPEVYRTPGSASVDFRWRQDYPHPDNVKTMWNECKPKLIWVLNMLTRSLPNNLQMLQYVAEKGMPIDYVEMGNEFNIINGEGRAKFPDALDYALMCKEWITEISKEFPATKFICVGENKGKEDSKKNDDLPVWNKTIVDNNPEVMLAWHFHCPYEYVSDGLVDVEVLRDSIPENFAHAFAGFPADRVCVTEFSVKQGLHTDKEDVQFANDNEEQLAVTELLKGLTAVGVHMACFHNVSGASEHGAIVSINRLRTIIRPSGIAIMNFIEQNK